MHSYLPLPAGYACNKLTPCAYSFTQVGGSDWTILNEGHDNGGLGEDALPWQLLPTMGRVPLVHLNTTCSAQP